MEAEGLLSGEDKGSNCDSEGMPSIVGEPSEEGRGTMEGVRSCCTGRMRGCES